MRLTVCLLLAVLSSCRRHAKEREAAAATQAAEAARPAEVKVLPAPGAARVQAAIRVKVSMNTQPLPEGIDCHVVFFDPDSGVSKRGEGDCGATVAIDPGPIDIEVTLSAFGGFEAKKRRNGESAVSEPKEVSIDVPWNVGRIRARHAEDPAITRCNVRIRGTQVAGDDSATYTVPAGTYGADFDCSGPRGMFKSAVEGLVVTQGNDTVAVFRLVPGEAPQPEQAADKVRITPGPSGTTQTLGAFGGIPGVPQVQYPADLPPTSSRPEELRVQSTKENP